MVWEYAEKTLMKRRRSVVSLRAKTEDLELKTEKRMDRREFFKKLCALSGTLIIPAGIIPAGCSQDGGTTEVSLPVSPTSSTTVFSKQAYENSIDTVFSVTHEIYGVVDLQLNLVADEIYITEAEQFSILLSGPESPVLQEHSYAVYNDNLGNIDLYIQPGDASNGQQHYVAVFSLLNV